MITRFYTGVTIMILLMVISIQILIIWKLLPFALTWLHTFCWQYKGRVQ